MVGSHLIVQEFRDPNPRFKSRKDTVMTKKLACENRLKVMVDWKVDYQVDIRSSDITCTCRNKGRIFYLHSDKTITAFDSATRRIFEFDATIYKSDLLAIEPYEEGVIFTSGKERFTYLCILDDKLVEHFC